MAPLKGMRIAFVYPPRSHRKFEEDLDVVSKEFGTFPPLGIMFAAAIAEKAGHECIIIDSYVEKLSIPETIARLEKFQPDMIGYLLTNYQFWSTYYYIRNIRKVIDVPVIVGNVAMELYPAEVMAHDDIDFGIIGSAQKPFPRLLECLGNGTDYSWIEGLCYKDNGTVRINWPSTLKEDFTTLPYPARHLIPNHMYHAVMTKRRNLSNMITYRGCPGSECEFCYVKEIPYTTRPAADTVGEFVECYEKHGIREIEVFDPTFTMYRKRALEIFQGIENSGIDLQYAIRTRVDKVDPELLAAAKRGGVKRILYGLESGNGQILAEMSKGITLQRVRDVVSMTQDAGIEALGFFLVGAPGETRGTANESIEWAIKLGLDFAQFHKTMAKPGTALYTQAMTVLKRDWWRRYMLGEEEEIRLPTPWTDMSHEEQEEMCAAGYRRFYLRPVKLAKTILGIRSWHEFRRYVRSGLGILFPNSDLVARPKEFLFSNPHAHIQDGGPEVYEPYHIAPLDVVVQAPAGNGGPPPVPLLPIKTRVGSGLLPERFSEEELSVRDRRAAAAAEKPVFAGEVVMPTSRRHKFKRSIDAEERRKQANETREKAPAAPAREGK